MELHPVGAELFHAEWRQDGRTDGRTWLKLVFAIRNFANAPKNDKLYKQWYTRMRDGMAFFRTRSGTFQAWCVQVTWTDMLYREVCQSCVKVSAWVYCVFLCDRTATCNAPWILHSVPRVLTETARVIDMDMSNARLVRTASLIS
jgi:hypothetical protein